MMHLFNWFGLPALVVGCALLPSPGAYAEPGCAAPAALAVKQKTRPGAEASGAIATWYADRQQYRCAARWFATASGLDPKSASLAYLWGLSLYSSGDAAGSIAVLDRAAELDAKDIRPHLLLGAALEKLQQNAKAEAEWRTVLSLDPDANVALDALSQMLVDRKDYAGVIALLETKGRNRTLSSHASLNLGIALAATVQLNEAEQVLRKALAGDQESLPIADELAMVLMFEGRTDEAYAVFEDALGRHPDDPRTQVLYLSALVTSHSDKAPQYAKKLLRTYPRDAQVLYLNGVVASREGDFAGARKLVEESVELNPENAQSQHLLGSTLATLGDDAGAREHLRKAIEAGDNQFEVHYELSRVMQRLGDAQGAADELRAYKSDQKAHWDKSQAAGKAEDGDREMASGNAARAATLYREAIERDPDEALLHYKLSKALDQLNEIAGEKSELMRAIAANPTLPEAQNQMGYLIAHEGNAEAAEPYLRAAVRAAPSYVIAWINLAATLASESKWQEAEDAITHALAADPGNAQAQHLRAAIAEARHP